MDIFIQQILNGLSIASVITLIAIGVTLIFGLTGIINFAHGEFLMIGGIVTWLAVSAGLGFPIAVVLAILAVGLMGYILERGLFRFTLERPTNGFIVSLGLIVVLQHVVVLFWNPNQKSIPRPLTTVWEVGGVRIASVRVMVILITIAVVALSFRMITASRYGRALRASVEDRDTAALMGIPVRRYITGVFVLGSALAGLGGALLIALFPITPFTGGTMVMKGFAVALIGGLGNIYGAVAAGLILGIVEGFSAGYGFSQWTDAYSFVLMILVLIVRPHGLFGGTSGPPDGVMKTGNALRSLLPVLVILALIAAVPLFSPSNRFLSLAISAGTNVIALYGLSVLFGQTGILSMGHAALVGVGAYAAAILARDFGVGFWTALPVAALASAVFAMIVGIPSLRVGGHHFVIMTFAFGQLLAIVLTNGGDYTGAATGLDIAGPVTLFGADMSDLTRYYLMVVAFVTAAAVASWAIIHSSYGRTLRAIRENEKLAASLGINVGRHKIGAFVVSGVFAGISGVLLAYFLGHISPSQFSSFPSIYLALMVMIGGARLIEGPLAGGILVAFLPEVLNLDPVQSRIVYGVCLIAVIMLLPDGLIGGIVRALRVAFSGKPKQEAERDAAPSEARQ